MRLSIGILARNEARTIGAAIDSLFEQSLLRAPPPALQRVTVLCVVNGTTDETAARAREAFARQESGERIRSAVHETPEPGKPNAWNWFVHELAEPDADALVLMDADIRFLSDRALEDLVAALEADPRANAAVGLPVKRFEHNGRRRSIIERLVAGASTLTLSGPPGLNGGLYAARTAVLREIWLPKELLVEDGYIRAMLVTDCFRRPDDFDRLVRAEAARYEFVPETTIRGLFRHRRRLTLGTALNILLFDRLWALEDKEQAGAFARRCMEQDRDWFDRMLQDHVRTAGRWALPGGLARAMLFGRFRQMRGLSWSRALRAAPTAVAAMIFEIPVLLAANSALRRRRLRW